MELSEYEVKRRVSEEPEFARQCLRTITDRFDWRSVFDMMRDDVFQVTLQTIGLERLTFEQLEYVAKRSYARLRDVRITPEHLIDRKPNPTTLNVWVVYWLFRNGYPDFPLYVGQTRNLSKRWTAHRNGSDQTAEIEDLTNLRIKVVETICGNEQDALSAERRHISAALLINPNLLNKASA